MGFSIARAGQNKDTLPLNTAEASAVGIVGVRAMGTLRLGTAGILGGWALQGYLAVGHCRDTWRLGTAGILQGYLAVGHCRDTAGIFGGWALQGYSAIGHFG